VFLRAGLEVPSPLSTLLDSREVLLNLHVPVMETMPSKKLIVRLTWLPGDPSSVSTGDGLRMRREIEKHQPGARCQVLL
jgi:hypothetical protein